MSVSALALLPAMSLAFPLVSPDGLQLAAMMDGSVAVGHLDEGEMVSMGNLGWFPVEWVNDQMLVVSTFKVWGVLNVDSGSLKVFEGARDVARMNSATVAVLGDVSASEREWLEDEGVAVVATDARQATSLVTGTDSVLLLTRDSGKHLYVRSDGSLITRTTVQDPDGRDAIHRPFNNPWIGDFRVLDHLWGEKLLALDGQQFPRTALSEIDLNTGAQKLIGELPEYGGVAAVIQDPETGAPLGIGVEGDTLSWVFLDDRVSMIGKRIGEELAGRDWMPTSISSDLQVWVLQSDAPDEGPRYWVYSNSEGVLNPLGKSPIPEGKLPGSTSVQNFPTSDGSAVAVYLTVPTAVDAVDSPKWPLVVWLHDGPDTRRFYWKYYFAAQRLASLGVAVAAVNYRGSDGYGRSFARAFGGGRDVEDVETTVRALVDDGVVDATRVAFLGMSYGSQLGLEWARASGDISPSCGVSITGTGVWPRKAGKAPAILAIAGGVDQAVPLASVRRMVRQLSAVGIRDTQSSSISGQSMVLFPSQGHLLPSAQLEAWPLVESFLASCLGVDSDNPYRFPLEDNVSVTLDGYSGLQSYIEGAAESLSPVRYPV
ncbi:MAG: prolyl oligopeptidase family serine peptidase, partial [Oligoflexia bacterium]|nr:prolyl oligopeptidase family serine peptidase [Oligoflexia bacterium]